jgi:hypothetical protein
MTASADRNELMSAQEKLEWVTPKISLMDAGDTQATGKKLNANLEDPGGRFEKSQSGPS